MFKTRQNWTPPLAEDCGDTEIARKKNQIGELFALPLQTNRSMKLLENHGACPSVVRCQTR